MVWIFELKHNLDAAYSWMLFYYTKYKKEDAVWRRCQIAKIRKNNVYSSFVCFMIGTIPLAALMCPISCSKMRWSMIAVVIRKCSAVPGSPIEVYGKSCLVERTSCENRLCSFHGVPLYMYFLSITTKINVELKRFSHQLPVTNYFYRTLP